MERAPAGAHDFTRVYGKEAIAKQTDDSALVRIVTLAPEMEGIGESVKMLADSGLVVSVGHR